MFCAKQDLKQAIKNECQPLRVNSTKQEFRTCKKNKKGQFRPLKNDCKGRIGLCKGCCRANYAGGCWGNFRGTAGYGTYFSCTRYYGRRYCTKPDCTRR
jgi:hypothetical protein